MPISKIDCRPYPADVWFTDDIESFHRKRRQISGMTDRMDDMQGCVSSSDNRGSMVIGLFVMDSSVLVHEISHAVINIFHFTGTPINLDTTEPFAYMAESIHQQCNDLLNKWSAKSEEVAA